jgi:hypothetical protein
MAAADNPYVAKAYDQGDMKPGSSAASIARQARFARYGFRCLIRRHELAPYLQKDLFPSYFVVPSPILLCEHSPKYPDPANPRPLVVHCPSHEGTKGTAAVLAAVDSLKRTHAFDFRLVRGAAKRECLAIMRDCDVMLDQFVLGDYGNASLEAMAFGKPTVCYVKPFVLSRCPEDFPIVNANPDNLVRVLGRLLDDGRLRLELGRKSRQYVEAHHDARKVAKELVGVYEQLLEEGRIRNGKDHGPTTPRSASVARQPATG